ncbi:alpha/beta hydrolase-fold protein [Flavobacteriaceae bacterium]|nr:alpha/beta hydrolase-fold protein [Flavobacteriaceae bacterium]
MKTKKFYSVLLLLIILMNVSEVFAQEYRYAIYEQEEKSLPYRILLPENYDTKKNYPLLLFLHGSGERGNDNELQLVHGSTLFLDSDFRKNNPAIIVFPQCAKDAYWATTTQTETGFTYVKKPKNNPTLDLVEGMLDDIIQNYGIDKKRIYVGGLSMGGMGTFELVYRNPKMFAAAFAICGGANPKIARKIRRPVWRIDHGEADQVVAVDLSKKMVAALLKKKATVAYNWYPGVNHNSWDTVFADPDFLPWLFAQKK